MKDQPAVRPVLFCGVVFLAVGMTALAGGALNVKEQMKPRGEIRILYNADTGTIMKQLPRDIRRKEDLYPFVDQLAANGVDVYIPDAFNAGMTLWNSALSPRWDQVRLPSYTTDLVKKTFEAGLEPIEVWADRCHEEGMKIVPSFRMNDRHNQGKLNNSMRASQMGPFLKENVHLWMKKYPGGLDYARPESRDYMFSLMAELVDRFDVDGLDLDYMRWCHVFDPGDPEKNMPILNAFMRRVRGMLNEEGEKKGRRLLLGVTAPPSLEECRTLSFDVATWISEGIIDYIAPMAFNDTNFDAAYEDFARLTRESDCKLFPTVNPYACATYKRILMSLPAYRGAARNFYVQGADGVYAFNYMYHWSGMEGMSYPGPPDMYPKSLAYFMELRNPAKLLSADRHYVSYPWPSYHGLADRTRKIVLHRGAAPTSGEYTFRAAEDFSGEEKALVAFNAAGLLPGDKVEVTFNGEVVPAETIERTFHEDGRTREEEGAKLPAYTSCAFVPTVSSGKYGENTLAVKLVEGAQGAVGVIDVREIEVAVSVGGKDPSEIMDLIHERELPGMPVLAGYHPHYSSVWKERRTSTGFGEEKTKEGTMTRSKLAQPFKLEKRARIKGVDVFLYPAGNAKETVHASIQTTRDGNPSGETAVAEATAEKNPVTSPEGINLASQGYWIFEFAEPIVLDAGVYWIVLEKGPADVSERRGYNAHMAEHPAQGLFAKKWTPGQGWHTRQKRQLFFGVHGQSVE